MYSVIAPSLVQNVILSRSEKRSCVPLRWSSLRLRPPGEARRSYLFCHNYLASKVRFRLFLFVNERLKEEIDENPSLNQPSHHAQFTLFCAVVSIVYKIHPDYFSFNLLYLPHSAIVASVSQCGSS